MGSRNFASQSPNNSQYLVNGVSDKKSVTNNRDEEFIFLYLRAHHGPKNKPSETQKKYRELRLAT